MDDLFAPRPDPRRPRGGRLAGLVLDHLTAVLTLAFVWSAAMLVLLDHLGYRGALDDACWVSLVATGTWAAMCAADRLNPLP